MNQEVKALWVQTLRNPKVKQGKAKLRSGDSFCCSGVLTELFRSSTANTKGLSWDRMESFGGRAITLCPEVMDWAGITNTQMLTVPASIGSKYHGVKQFMLLPDLNDAGISFEDLASLIQEQL
jgi:hypothetical protein